MSRLIGIFGPTGSGKTTEAVYSCYGGMAAIGQREAFLQATTRCGVEMPSLVQAWTIVAATKQLRVWRKKGLPKGTIRIVVDDASDLMEAYIALEKPNWPQEGAGVWNFWAHIREVALEFRSACLHFVNREGIPVVITGHSQGPAWNDGETEYYRGGLKIGSRKFKEEFAKRMTHLLRCWRDDSVKLKWKMRYWVEHNHEDWITKDRDSVFAVGGAAPHNLAEHLRRATDWPRAADLVWMEDVVEALADHYRSGATEKAIRKLVNDELSDLPIQHRYWIRRDARDRATIEQLYNESFED